MPRDFLGKFNVSSDLQFTPGIVMLEDCEGTCTWEMIHTGDDSVIEFTTEHCMFGTQGLLIQTRTANAAEDDFCSATRRVSYPESNLLVIRGRISVLSQVAVKTVDMFMGWARPAADGIVGLQWDVANSEIKVWKTGGEWETLAGMGFQAYDKTWHDFEIVVDTLMARYKSVMFGGVRAEPETIPCTNINELDYREVFVKLTVIASMAIKASVVYDSIYVGNYLDV